MEIRHIRLSGFPFRRYTWPLFGLEVQFAGDASVAVAENCRGNDGMAAEVSVKYQIFHVLRTGFGNNPAVRAPGVFDVDDRSTSPGFIAIPSAPVPPEDRISVQCHSLVRWLFPSHVSEKHNKVQSRKSFCVDILPPYAGQTPEPSLHSSPSTASPLRAVGWESCLLQVYVHGRIHGVRLSLLSMYWTRCHITRLARVDCPSPYTHKPTRGSCRLA